MPLPPTGVELDLLVLGARQRLRALARGAGLLFLSVCLLPGAGVLLIAAGVLALGGGGGVTFAVLAASLIVGTCGWLAGRRGWRQLGRALRMRHAMDTARLHYERAVLEVEARRHQHR